MKTPTFSIHIPYWKTIHFAEGRKVGESRPACFKGLAHYDRRNKPIGTSARNFIGELNHYDNSRNCIGYSRRRNWGMIVHYSNRGKKIGYTYNVCGVILVHSFELSKSKRHGGYQQERVC